MSKGYYPNQTSLTIGCWLLFSSGMILGWWIKGSNMKTDLLTLIGIIGFFIAMGLICNGALVKYKRKRKGLIKK